jgi:hypothetical protein
MREEIAEAIIGWGYDISARTRGHMADAILSLITERIKKEGRGSLSCYEAMCR